MTDDKMEKIVALAKRRGFVYPACEIYGGFTSAHSFGPYGVELKNNVKAMWWKRFVQDRPDVVGLDGPIILCTKLWEASGHTEGFHDALVDCKKCKKRFRADHLIEEATGKDLEGKLDEMNKVIGKGEIACPECGKLSWTEVRTINMMFETVMNGVEGPVYLRPETAGAIFVEYKSVLDSMRVRIPFGIAQIGKAFRNEIVTGNFIFRVREFEQMEIEYFIHPKEKWEKLFDGWLKMQMQFAMDLGADKKDLREYEHPKEKLSHYSRKTVDIEYNFPFGFKELFGLAHRGDFDLKAHAKASGEKLEYLDPTSKEKFVPHVLEPTFGVERALLVALCAAYTEEEVDDGTRVVMKFPKNLAPVKIAVFPLLKNKPTLVKKAIKVFDALKDRFVCEFDDNGNIGKRYRRQDEIGTPYCVTVDFDTLDNGEVTVRDRDTMEQERVKIDELATYFEDKF
ncbi:MAG: glycine--tRNA ligase [Candidatus Uhrbacteria bacterium]|nr:glycine--tRNA ligase [Patescibacteria group bacterium]MBU1906989.1 glycine--tRNA ligase [Patescibacteria group bacterium]